MEPDPDETGEAEVPGGTGGTDEPASQADAPIQTVTVDLTEEEAKQLMQELVDNKFLTWQHIAKKVLQTFQPPQTGTHVTGMRGIKERYPKNKRWASARAWLYAQFKSCECGEGLSMTHDHVLPRDLLADKADLLENLRFLCHRCNQSRGWKRGGKLKMGTAAAAIYLMIKYKPRTWRELLKLSKELGLSQSAQRMEESWARAIHLSALKQYEIDEIHPTLTPEGLASYQAYFRETNDFFETLRRDIEERFADRKDRWEMLQRLVAPRSTNPRARLEAAEALGIHVVPSVQKLLARPEFTPRICQAVLKAFGGLSAADVTSIVADKRHKVALYHLMTEPEKKEILQSINDRITQLREKHGVSDPNAIPLSLVSHYGRHKGSGRGSRRARS